jgi:hypothetical protein
MASEKIRSNFVRDQEGDGSWAGRQTRFMGLAREEQGRAEAITKGEVLQHFDKVLRAHCDYKDHAERVFVAEEVRSFYETLGIELTSEDLSKIEAKMLEWAELEKKAGLKAPETGRWIYGTGAVSENLRERVRLCVAEAGRALPQYRKGTDPEDFWLHRLYLDLVKNNSDLLFCGTKEGGMILSVCVASATFCARLERSALQEAEPSGITAGHNTRQPEPEQPSQRLRATISSPIAAARMENYLKSKGIGQTDFAATVGTTDRTLRSFRRTGRIRRDILDSIAIHMGMTKEALLTPD